MEKQMKKRIICCWVLFCMLLVLGGCGETTSENIGEEALFNPEESSLENVVYTLENGKCPARMPHFSATYDSAVIDGLNQEVKELHQTLFEPVSDTDVQMDVKVENFENDRYLQSVICYVSYPLVGGYGDVISYNYDRVQDKRLTLTDAFVLKNTTLDDVRQMVIDSCFKTKPLMENETTIYGATVDGFVLDDKDNCVFYGNVDLCINGNTQWSYIYQFDFETQEIEIYDLEL